MVERVLKFFENLKFFWDDAENGHNDANILKNIIVFEFFLKFIKTKIKNWVATIIIDLKPNLEIVLIIQPSFTSLSCKWY